MKDNDDSSTKGTAGRDGMKPSGLAAAGGSLSREELRALAGGIPERLPAERVTETSVVLMDVDPCHVHVYWSISPADLDSCAAAVAAGNGEHTLVLRLHDALCRIMAGFIPWQPLELEVSGLQGYRYVEIPDCGKTLVAELGLRGPSGIFAPLGASGPVRLPLQRPAWPEQPARAAQLVVIDEPGNPPRVVEVLPPASARGGEDTPGGSMPERPSPGAPPAGGPASASGAGPGPTDALLAQFYPSALGGSWSGGLDSGSGGGRD